MALNARQQRFVEEYLIDCNATQAAIRAKYSVKTAARIGSRLLINVDVSRAIAAARAAQAQRCQLDADYVLNGLQEVVQRSLTRKPVLVFDPVGRCMRHVTDDEGNLVYMYDSQGVNRALELIGKHLGMFSDKFTGDLTINVVRKDRTLHGPNERDDD